MSQSIEDRVGAYLVRRQDSAGWHKSSAIAEDLGVPKALVKIAIGELVHKGLAIPVHKPGATNEFVAGPTTEGISLYSTSADAAPEPPKVGFI